MKRPGITEHDKARLTDVSRALCDEFDLDRLYFTQVLGKRRHFLAGCGHEGFVPSGHMGLSENLAVFWQGPLPERAQQELRTRLAPIVADIEKDLNRSTAHDDEPPAR
ncbi:MAG: hypothetical protein JXR94_13020 [Candidatus Hydrogenedentes bacterium]|nr:hypothetical protein [Candidatus Hydrogenedentota bacterium]